GGLGFGQWVVDGGENRVADQLLPLQLANHLAIVRRGEPFRLGDLRGDLLYLVLPLGKLLTGQRGEPIRRNVDADAAQRERILFWTQPEVVSRLGQNLFLPPAFVFGHLLLELCQRLLIPLDVIAREQIGHAVNEEVRACEIGFGLNACRAALARPRPFGRARLDLLRQRLEAGLHADVFAETNQRGAL